MPAEEDKALVKEAHLIQEEVAAHQDVISLDQPHPDELAAEPSPVLPLPDAETPPGETPSAEPKKNDASAAEPVTIPEGQTEEPEPAPDAKADPEPVTVPDGQTEEKPAESPPPKEDKEEGEEEKEEGATNPTGYTAGDVAKALVTPPTPVITETKKEVKNPHVKFLVAIGVALALIGIILLVLIDAILGSVVVLFGVIFIIATVFLPVQKLFKNKPKKEKKEKSEK